MCTSPVRGAHPALLAQVLVTSSHTNNQPPRVCLRAAAFPARLPCVRLSTAITKHHTQHARTTHTAHRACRLLTINVGCRLASAAGAHARTNAHTHAQTRTHTHTRTPRTPAAHTLPLAAVVVSASTRTRSATCGDAAPQHAPPSSPSPPPCHNTAHNDYSAKLRHVGSPPAVPSVRLRPPRKAWHRASAERTCGVECPPQAANTARGSVAPVALVLIVALVGVAAAIGAHGRHPLVLCAVVGAGDVPVLPGMPLVLCAGWGGAGRGVRARAWCVQGIEVGLRCVRMPQGQGRI
jgi:hypothetical protein